MDDELAEFLERMVQSHRETIALLEELKTNDVICLEQVEKMQKENLELLESFEAFKSEAKNEQTN